ncbi:MAG TPA: hypothetical protein VLI65_03455, partial [Pyrinomonadaceae bacterium]|nr:hypothetical protein [Pyrinomonadaceae bacterium]
MSVGFLLAIGPFEAQAHRAIPAHRQPHLGRGALAEKCREYVSRTSNHRSISKKILLAEAKSLNYNHRSKSVVKG